MKFTCQVFDAAGHASTEVLEAPSAVEAAERLRQRNLFVGDVADAGAADAPEAGPVRKAPSGRTRRLKQTAMFTRQLHMLVQTGTPLAEGLKMMERQPPAPAWRDVIADIRQRLERGVSLADAIKPHGQYFDPIYHNMVAAGESAGKLPAMLDRLADLLRRQAHTRSVVAGALVYPCLLLLMAAGVLTVMMIFVIPRFAELFAALGAPLPASTAALLGLSQLMRSHWWVFLGGAVLGGLALRTYFRSPAGRVLLDTAAIRLPHVGALARSLATARMARLLGVLIDSYLPITEVLRLTKGSVGNIHYARLITQAQDAVARGEPVSAVLAESDLLTPGAGAAIRSGEQSGRIAPLLTDLAGFLDEENEVRLKTLTGLLEPAILVVMGVVVGFVAVSIFLPLFDAGALSGGPK